MNELFHDLLMLPPQASTLAQRIDTLHYTVIGGTMLGAALVGFIALFFAVRYPSRGLPFRGTPRVVVPTWLEAGFIAGTLALFLIWWQIGFAQFVELGTPPSGTLDVYVTAKQWMWKFSYPDGPSTVAVLYVPTGRPVKLIMTSRDVIHSFYVPAFRVKRDVVPGRYTTLWFQAKQPGHYDILCAEYCGTDHSMMRGEVIVLEPSEYATFVRGLTPPPAPTEAMPGPPAAATEMARQGELAAERNGCMRCHSVDGTPHIGPTWVGLYGSTRRFEDGTTRLADEAYLTESMMDPARQIVAGYRPVMPSYLGRLDPADTAAILELIKSLADRPEKDARPVLPDAPIPPQGPVFVPEVKP